MEIRGCVLTDVVRPSCEQFVAHYNALITSAGDRFKAPATPKVVTMELTGQYMSGHWGSSSGVKCPSCGREDMVSDNEIYRSGWGGPPTLPRCKHCSKPAAAAAPPGNAAGGSFDAKVANLQARFPDKEEAEVRRVLSETGGHAGKAVGILGQAKALPPPARRAEKPTSTPAAPAKPAAEQEEL